MITIPVWIIALLVPLFVTILIAVVANIKVSAKNNGRFETCIENLNGRIEKVDIRLDRVETKLDNFIIKNLHHE